jgi:retron-type reverse transcriptase
MHHDHNKYVGAILMDLSKAFDYLPHDLLLLKLKHYGVSDSALNLLDSYISDRKQCVKVGQHTSTFQNIFKGVPQGSILEPVLFNVFLNNIFGFVKHSTLYNYADDNTVYRAHHDVTVLKTSLETDSKNSY